MSQKTDSTGGVADQINNVSVVESAVYLSILALVVGVGAMIALDVGL